MPISGCFTNIIPAVIVTESDVGEVPLFSDLLKTAVNLGFKVKEISADKAYFSRINYTVADELGISAYIPFRSDSSGHSKGAPIWKKVFYRFQEHQEEFEQHYHKRENVETDFSAIKRTLHETLKSKNKIAQQNELLCKILSYNIMVNIHEAQKHNLELHPFGDHTANNSFAPEENMNLIFSDIVKHEYPNNSAGVDSARGNNL